MSDLVAFVRARLDEDQTWALLTGSTHQDRSVHTWRADHGDVFADDGLRMAEARSANVAPHIARHDPARVLREVAAKREILEQLATDLSYEPPVPPGHRRAWAIAAFIAESMAAAYSDHPDYDETWRP